MKFAVAATVALISAVSASAAVVTYTGFDQGAYLGATPSSDAAAMNFSSALAASSLISFENVSIGSRNFTTQGVSFSGQNFETTDAYQAGVTGSNDPVYGFNTTSVGSRHYRFTHDDTNSDATTLTLTFSVPVNGVGFYYTGASTVQNGGMLDVMFTDGSVQSLALSSGVPGSGNVSFFGFTTEALLSQIVLRQSGYGNSLNRDIFGIDDVRFGVIPQDVIPTPEPAMLGLFGLGAIGLAFARRRKTA